MNKLVCAVATVALCATGLAANVKSGEKIAFLGDSQALSQRRLPEQVGMTYVGIVDAAIKTNLPGVVFWAPFDPGKDTSAGLLERVTRHVLTPKASQAVFVLGAADAAKNVPLADFKANVTKLVETVQGAQVKVVLVTSAQFGETKKVAEKNEALLPYVACVREIARAKGCTLVDVHQAVCARIADYRTRTGGVTGFLYEGAYNYPTLVGGVVMAETILKDGFGFTAAELAKTQSNVIDVIPVGLNVYAGFSEGDGFPICLNWLRVTGRDYLGLIEGAVTDKCSVDSFIKKRISRILKERAAETLERVCK